MACTLLALVALLTPTFGVLFDEQFAGWSPYHGHMHSSATEQHTHPYNHAGRDRSDDEQSTVDSRVDTGTQVFTPFDMGSVDVLTLVPDTSEYLNSRNFISYSALTRGDIMVLTHMLEVLTPPPQT